MTDPYTPSRAPAHEYSADHSELNWHRKVALGALLILGASSTYGVARFIIYTKPLLGIGFLNLYSVILHPILILSSAFLLYRKSKHAYLPLAIATLILLWRDVLVFKQIPHLNLKDLYGTFADQVIQYITGLPRILVMDVVYSGILVGVVVYCLRQRKKGMLV